MCFSPVNKDYFYQKFYPKQMNYLLQSTTQTLSGEIQLDGSKSISNRALIIRALCSEDFDIHHLSTSDDTNALLAGLKTDGEIIDVGAAGTTMRFLTALCACSSNKTTTLTGSSRMKQRPIGILVTALRKLGADISYTENEGFPPLRINGKKLEGGELQMEAGVSSQYLSAMLMIAPTLEKGLQLTLIGDLVSRPYLEMTLKLMERFGVKHHWDNNTIAIAPQTYKAAEFTVEADWSAASYHYALAALAQKANIRLYGLFNNSLQGDAALVEMMKPLGIISTFGEGFVDLEKTKTTTDFFEYDFLECPDLAQTLAVVCAGLKINARFTGLQTLAIKETDRTAALQTELAKINTRFFEEENGWNLVATDNFTNKTPTIATYHDHRMAMAFAPLAMVLSKGIYIEDPMVVTKSYGQFYEDFMKLGIEYIEDTIN